MAGFEQVNAQLVVTQQQFNLRAANEDGKLQNARRTRRRSLRLGSYYYNNNSPHFHIVGRMTSSAVVDNSLNPKRVGHIAH